MGVDFGMIAPEKLLETAKQLEPQLMLQLPDLLGQGRLGDVEGVCRSSKALLFSNG